MKGTRQTDFMSPLLQSLQKNLVRQSDPGKERPLHTIKDAAGIEAEPEKSLKSIEATASETRESEWRVGWVFA